MISSMLFAAGSPSKAARTSVSSKALMPGRLAASSFVISSALCVSSPFAVELSAKSATGRPHRSRSSRVPISLSRPLPRLLRR